MKNWILHSFFISNVLLQVESTVQICTNRDNFTFLFRNQNIKAVHFDVVKDRGLVGCALECQLRKRCKSFSFQYASGACSLFATPLGDSEILYKDRGTDSSDIQDWPSRLAGLCENHPCSFEEVCRVTSQGRKCVKAYCPPLTDVENAKPNFTTTYETTKVGSHLSYVCDENFKPQGERVCLENGTWSDFRCVRDVPRCPVEEGYVYFENVTVCFKAITEKVSWIEARYSCNQSGSRLIVLDNDDKNSVVSNYVKTNTARKRYYIGLSYKPAEAMFVWVNGETVAFTKWKDEPDEDDTSERCVILITVTDNWNDIGCSVSRCYICEIPL